MDLPGLVTKFFQVILEVWRLIVILSKQMNLSSHRQPRLCGCILFKWGSFRCLASIYSKHEYSIWGNLPVTHRHIFALVPQSFRHLLHQVASTDYTFVISGGSIGFSLKRCDLDHLGTLDHGFHQGFHQGTKCSRYHSQSSTVPSGSLPKAKPRPSSSETRTSWKPLLSWRFIRCQDMPGR